MKNKLPVSGTFRSVIRQNKVLTAAVFLLILCSVLCSLLPPLALEELINRLTKEELTVLEQTTASDPGTASFFMPALVYFFSLSAAGLLEAAQNGVITLFGQKITRNLRKQMCAKLSRLPASYFTANEPGKTVSRFVNDVDAVDALFTNGIVSMFADACKVISIIGVIFWKSRGLGTLLLLITPLLFFFTRMFQKRMLKAQLANRTAVGKVNNHIPETIRNIRMIHTLFRQKYMEQRYDDYIQESYRAVEKSNLYDSIYSPIVIFISSCVVALMMILSAMGGRMQAFFGMSVGTAVAVIAYVGKVFDPLESIGMEIQNIQSAFAGVQRIQEFLDEKERPAGSAAQTSVPASGNTWSETKTGLIRFEPEADTIQSNVEAGTIRFDSEADAIRFDHVRFGYDSERPVLNDLSFAVKTGQCATLTGRTGAGKSTVFRLLLGLFTPQKGRITICGIDAAAIPDSRKRSLFGYVEQTFQLLPGTVAEQISLFDPAISQAQIEQAARLIGLHETILSLEHSYDTMISESLFSQGQLQLLSIARAIAADPAILLLDEITANLDSETERRIMDALVQASKNRTVLSTSHRLYKNTMEGTLIPIPNKSE